VREQPHALLQEIIKRINDLFEGDLTEGDHLVYVNGVLKGKLLESEILQEQAMSNSKEQFGNSPDIDSEMENAAMDAMAAHALMNQQVLNSKRVRDGLKEILLGPGGLWEALRQQADTEIISSSTCAQSPTIGTSARTVLLIDDGSMSTWIFFEPGEKASSRRVTRSSKRAPMLIITSQRFIVSLR